MAERHQPAVADQQVEGASEQREAQRLHQEDRIGDERRDGEDRHQGDEGDHLRVGARGGCDPRHRISDPLHHALRPNRPAGRINSTIAMMTKITVADASGQNTLVRPSTMPSPKPVRIAPMIEPMPPITTTANTMMMRSLPICGLTL